MTNEERNAVCRMHAEGLGYRAIAARLSLPTDSVKSWCRRHPVKQEGVCLHCGTAIIQTPHKRTKKFCSDECRNAWWSAHPEKRSTKTVYRHVCLGCGKDYCSNRISGSYCSRKCFARARQKENGNG